MRRGFSKVFGIGLSRTGTRSLAAALTQLGLATVHFPNNERTFAQLTSGDFRLAVLDEHDAITDTPASAFYRQLDRAFPGSRFILTTRPREEWLASCERRWRYTAAAQRRPFHRYINSAVYGTWAFSPGRFAYVYDRHLREVREYFRARPGELLELERCAGGGWDPLCAFLGLPVPGVPFPHEDILVG